MEMSSNMSQTTESQQFDGQQEVHPPEQVGVRVHNQPISDLTEVDDRAETKALRAAAAASMAEKAAATAAEKAAAEKAAARAAEKAAERAAEKADAAKAAAARATASPAEKATARAAEKAAATAARQAAARAADKAAAEKAAAAARANEKAAAEKAAAAERDAAKAAARAAMNSQADRAHRQRQRLRPQGTDTESDMSTLDEISKLKSQNIRLQMLSRGLGDAVRIDIRDNLLEDEDSLRKMKNSDALRMHLLINGLIGMPLVTLFAQFALFTAIIFVRETGFYARYDSRGIKTALSYHISALMVSNSWRLSQFGLIHRRCGIMANSIANGACLILAILMEKFYEKSLSSLGFAFSIAVLFLMLLVIVRPSTDFGFLGFLIGVILSVAYNHFGIEVKTWMVVAICVLLFWFKFWLDKKWLDVEHQSLDPLPPISKAARISMSNIMEAVTVAGVCLLLEYNLFRTTIQNLNVPDSDSKSVSPMAIVASVFMSCVWFALILLPRFF